MKLPMIPQDKANHFIYGFVIFILSNLILNAYFALAIVFCFAAGKEVYDKVSGKGTPEILDFVATLIPAIILTLIKL